MIRTLYSIVLFFSVVSIFAGNKNSISTVTPLDLEFHRLAVRRFIFSNNILLNEFVPSQVVDLKSMHPAFLPSANDEPRANENFRPVIRDGKLVLTASSGNASTSIFAGGINPYASYELDVEKLADAADGSAEAGIELASYGLRNRIQVVVRSGNSNKPVYLKIFRNNKLIRETKAGEVIAEGRFLLRVQLYGRSLGIFITQNDETVYLAHLDVNDNFGEIADFRNPRIAAESTFNICTNLTGETHINGARSFLSPGIGQADIRLVSYEDLSPYFYEDRIWFTFSCRGLDTPQSVQGVFSLNPSVFDLKFEGMIVFDHGDGLLRNDYASHLFYDRVANEWRAYASDFGGTAGVDHRTDPGILTAKSSRSPLKGFSVMKARKVSTEALEGHNEDPCVLFDSREGKWRLLTSVFVNNNIISRTFESDKWDGKYTPVSAPLNQNSTGTSIQKVGERYYAFMGGHGNLRVHSYPELTFLGELKLHLQPHWPKPAGRIWASLVPLPEGYPYNYVLLTMDRPNFPGVRGPNWSYGALYFYGAGENTNH